MKLTRAKRQELKMKEARQETERYRKMASGLLTKTIHQERRIKELERELDPSRFQNDLRAL